MLDKALTGIAAIAISACFSVAQAQDTKLYAFSSGALTIGKGNLVNNAPNEPTDPGPGRLLRHQASEGQRALRYRQQRQDHQGSELLGRLRSPP